jgi:hypothetical protein
MGRGTRCWRRAGQRNIKYTWANAAVPLVVPSSTAPTIPLQEVRVITPPITAQTSLAGSTMTLMSSLTAPATVTTTPVSSQAAPATVTTTPVSSQTAPATVTTTPVSSQTAPATLTTTPVLSKTVSLPALSQSESTEKTADFDVEHPGPDIHSYDGAALPVSFHQKNSLTVTSENLASRSISDLKFPAKISTRGRPKATAKKTAIGLPRHKRTCTPFEQKSVSEKVHRKFYCMSQVSPVYISLFCLTVLL